MSEHEMYSYDLNSTHYPTAPSASGLSDADEIVARELMALNPAQQEGAMTVTGPVLVIAGAGSGKTKMLTARIINLMASYHVPGSRILAVTFTNKAAGEMRERISRALGLSPDSRSILGLDIGSSVVLQVPMVGTFHSVCTRILRRELLHTPFAQQFVIYDDSEQLSVIKECFQKLQISDAAFSPKAFQYAINQAKCAAKEPNDITNPANPFEKNLVRVYALYQQEMFARNAIDFGEIITLTYRVLKNNPDLFSGLIWTGEKAIELGLVDALGSSSSFCFITAAPAGSAQNPFARVLPVGVTGANSMFADGVHPSLAGHGKFGDAVYAALKAKGWVK